jgi:hypothetical protein
MTAAVALSGQLDECKTDEDLRQAVEHTMTLVNCGVYTTEQWSEESQRVEKALLEWGDEFDAQPWRVAERN